MTVLWVENDARFVRVAGDLFLSRHELVVCPTVREAIEQLRARVFDAVLLDFDLDDGKGVDVLAFSRTLSTRPRVIAASSHEGGNAAMIDAGADAICAKADFANVERFLFAGR